MAKTRKTREMLSKDEWKCPVHGETVEHRVRTTLSKEGSKKFAGSYYACPSYSECKYYVTPNGHVPIL